jgi:hypothetical protein
MAKIGKKCQKCRKIAKLAALSCCFFSYFALRALRAFSTGVFCTRFRARNGVDLQLDELLCAKLFRAVNVAQSRAPSRAQKREHEWRRLFKTKIVTKIALKQPFYLGVDYSRSRQLRRN